MDMVGKGKEADASRELEKFSPQDTPNHRSLAARANWFAFDRGNLLFSAESVNSVGGSASTV